MVVVGNKVDQKSHRAVSAEEGLALAEEFNASFLEVSVCIIFIPWPSFISLILSSFISCGCLALQAKDNFKVRDAFETLIRTILSEKPSAGQGAGSGVFGSGEENRLVSLVFSRWSLLILALPRRDGEDTSAVNVKMKGKSKDKKKSTCLIL
jgi:hypothetical protein